MCAAASVEGEAARFKEPPGRSKQENEHRKRAQTKTEPAAQSLPLGAEKQTSIDRTRGRDLTEGEKLVAGGRPGMEKEDQGCTAARLDSSRLQVLLVAFKKNGGAKESYRGERLRPEQAISYLAP